MGGNTGDHTIWSTWNDLTSPLIELVKPFNVQAQIMTFSFSFFCDQINFSLLRSWTLWENFNKPQNQPCLVNSLVYLSQNFFKLVICDKIFDLKKRCIHWDSFKLLVSFKSFIICELFLFLCVYTLRNQEIPLFNPRLG